MRHARGQGLVPRRRSEADRQPEVAGREPSPRPAAGPLLLPNQGTLVRTTQNTSYLLFTPHVAREYALPPTERPGLPGEAQPCSLPKPQRAWVPAALLVIGHAPIFLSK